MKYFKTMTVVVAMFAVLSVFGAQQAMAGSVPSTATVTVTDFCELVPEGPTIALNSGDPVNNGAGDGTGQIQFDLSNGVVTPSVNAAANVGIFVDAFFLDVTTSSLQVMQGGNMFVSGDTGNLASKTSVSILPLTPTPLDVVEPGETDSGFYDVIIVLNGPDGANFADDADIGVTFEFMCQPAA